MAFRKLFFKRVNETRSNFVLAEGDIALDESTFKLFRGDGSTVGGVAISATGIENLVEDTTPQLGGNLDVNSKSIVSASNGNIAITPDGSGKIILDGLSFPTADGSANQVLQTDGSGNLSFATTSTSVVADTTPQLGGDLDINGQDIVSTSNANIDIAPNGTGDILLKTNGSSGRVGMGTVGNPDTALHIKSSASIVTLQRTDDSKTPGISFQNSNGNTRGSVKIDGTGGTSNEIFMETYDGSSQAERFRVQHTGAKVTGILKIGDGSVTDNYAGFGDADDLKIFHNGSHSIIRETGTGSLYVQSDNNVILGSDSGSETYVKGIYNGAVELYYDNSKKLETTYNFIMDVPDEGSSEPFSKDIIDKKIETLRAKNKRTFKKTETLMGDVNRALAETIDAQAKVTEKRERIYENRKVISGIRKDIELFTDD